jgi:hypothetical protein
MGGKDLSEGHCELKGLGADPVCGFSAATGISSAENWNARSVLPCYSFPMPAALPCNKIVTTFLYIANCLLLSDV